jgi:hypothetical protein
MLHLDMTHLPKYLEKGTIKLGSENVKACKFLLVEYLKHNLLSVSKICDQGYTLRLTPENVKSEKKT